jgi:hypothetical protein
MVKVFNTALLNPRRQTESKTAFVEYGLNADITITD